MPYGPLFGDEASFAQWGTIGYTWALKGVQPTVKTSGIRQAYRVFGLLDCFGGTLYQQGLAGKKFNSETDATFLTWVLTQTTDRLIVIQDNAKDHVSADMRTFYAQNTDRLTVYQLPPYSPDLNPIEGHLKKVKKDATHLKWFPTFTDLVTRVETTLTKLAGLPAELTALHGKYRHLLLPAEVAHDLLSEGLCAIRSSKRRTTSRMGGECALLTKERKHSTTTCSTLGAIPNRCSDQ